MAQQPTVKAQGVSNKLVARGYSDVDASGKAIPHPMAKTPAATTGADRGAPWIAKDGERIVPKLDTTSGLTKTLRSLKHVPAAGQGRDVASVSGQGAPKANGSGALPRKAK